jgi:predicted Rossmann fold nucleotide-binding protein DprA/Smf involved in DNA uptake
VLDAMLGPGVRKAERAGPPLDSPLLDVLAAVERGAETCDAIASELDLDGGDAASALATLEALGYVTCSLVGVYSRTLLTVPGV